MNVLVTGGAGYIGSHAVAALVTAGHQVCVVDNLCAGHRAAVHCDAVFHKCDLSDTDRITSVLRDHDVDCVMHFAAFASVAESVAQPLLYYRNNVAGSISLLTAMTDADVKRLVFSSTTATYGEPASQPISEETPQQPTNPYGASKLNVEGIVIDQCAANKDFGCVALRYFNVAGCAADGSLGEDHEPETHVIPLLLRAAQTGQPFTVFGNDYATRDGTCIRDYVHVEDISAAHIRAIAAIQSGTFRAFNVGIGRGYSVREIIAAVQRVTEKTISLQWGERRPGDPPELVADAKKIGGELGWEPQFTDIDQIVATAWRWYQTHPNGYAD